MANLNQVMYIERQVLNVTKSFRSLIKRKWKTKWKFDFQLTNGISASTLVQIVKASSLFSGLDCLDLYKSYKPPCKKWTQLWKENLKKFFVCLKDNDICTNEAFGNPARMFNVRKVQKSSYEEPVLISIRFKAIELQYAP